MAPNPNPQTTTNRGEPDRHNIRLLLPGPDDGLREAVERTGAAILDALPLVARHGAVEALAVDNLRGDELRVMTRFVNQQGGCVVVGSDGKHAVVMAPLMAMGELPTALRAWGRGTEQLADALATVLMGRHATPVWTAHETRLDLSGARVIAVSPNADVDASDGGVRFIDVAAPDVKTLWPTVATTSEPVVLSAAGAAMADRCSSLRDALAAAGDAGVGVSRIAVMLAGDSGVNRAALRRVGQLRSLARPVIVDIRGETGNPVAIGLTAIFGGAHGIFCQSADVTELQSALAATAGLF